MSILFLSFSLSRRLQLQSDRDNDHDQDLCSVRESSTTAQRMQAVTPGTAAAFGISRVEPTDGSGPAKSLVLLGHKDLDPHAPGASRSKNAKEDRAS